MKKEKKHKGDVRELMASVVKGIGAIAVDIKGNTSKLESLESDAGELSKKLALQEERFNLLDKTLDIIRERAPENFAGRVHQIDKGLVADAKLGLIEVRLKSLEEETSQLRMEMQSLKEISIGSVESEETLGQNRVFHLQEAARA